MMTIYLWLSVGSQRVFGLWWTMKWLLVLQIYPFESVFSCTVQRSFLWKRTKNYFRTTQNILLAETFSVVHFFKLAIKLNLLSLRKGFTAIRFWCSELQSESVFSHHIRVTADGFLAKTSNVNFQINDISILSLHIFQNFKKVILYTVLFSPCVIIDILYLQSLLKVLNSRRQRCF